MIEKSFNYSQFNIDWIREIYLNKLINSSAVGKDGTTKKVFFEKLDDECHIIYNKINNGSYKFTAYKEKLITRGVKRFPRQISIPTIRDRLALRVVLEVLKIYFPESQPIPPHNYIKEIKGFLKTTGKDFSFLRMDIRDFYPSINHSMIEKILNENNLHKNFISLIMKALKNPTGSAKQNENATGIPQGLSISNSLSSIFMREFDTINTGKYPFYRRYVDDIIVIDKNDLIGKDHLELESRLTEMNLKSHPLNTMGKTEIKKVTDGVQYLGYEISDEKTSIRKTSIDKMFLNLSKVITCIKYKEKKNRHIYRLNLKITGCIFKNRRLGWIMFFSQTDNVSQLKYIDKWIKYQLHSKNINIENLKTITKSYHEIRFNFNKTQYIPNFDILEIEKKKQILLESTDISTSNLDSMSKEEIECEFERVISREVSELERDIIESTS